MAFLELSGSFPNYLENGSEPSATLYVRPWLALGSRVTPDGSPAWSLASLPECGVPSASSLGSATHAGRAAPAQR